MQKIAFVLMLLSAPAHHAAAQAPDAIELTMQTRGTTKALTVDADRTTVRVNDDTRRVKTPPAQWKRLLRHLDGLRLADLPKLKATTPRSAVDAAYQAQLRVTQGGKTYETEPFDYPNAPQPLAGLLKALVETAPQPERTEF